MADKIKYEGRCRYCVRYCYGHTLNDELFRKDVAVFYDPEERERWIIEKKKNPEFRVIKRYDDREFIKLYEGIVLNADMKELHRPLFRTEESILRIKR